MAQNCIRQNCVNGAGVNDKGPAHGRVGVNPEHCPIVIQRSGTTESESKFRVGTLNVGTLRGRSGEVVETLSRRKVDVCCVQETRWRGASARMVTGKESEYKIFWVGNNKGTGGVGLMVNKKWVDKVIDVKRVNDRLMLIKLMVGKRVVAVVSAYAPQQGLTEEEKDKFYEDLISLTSKVGDNEFLIIGGDLNGHVGKDADGYQGIHGGYGYGNRNVEGERILEMGAALDMVVCNTYFKKRDTRLITYTSGPSMTQIDYIMIRSIDKKVVTDVKVIPGEEVAQQHHLLVCDILVSQVKEIKKKFVEKRKVWKLKDDLTKAEFEDHFRSKSEDTEGNVEDLWSLLKDDLLASADAICGWTKGPARHKVTWWWNDCVDEAVKEKRRLWKAWKKGGSKEDYLEAKRASKRAVYNAKRAAEQERFGDVLCREDHRDEVFKIAKQMKSTNRDVVGDKCVRDDKGVLATSDQDKHRAWQEHYERLLNEEFDWDKENLTFDDPILGPPPEIDAQSVRDALAKMKKGKASGTSGVVAEMLLASGEPGIQRLTQLFNKILVDNEIPEDWNTSVIVNCFKNKGEAVERGNYRGLKLLEHAMKVFERVIEQKIRNTVDINAMQFGFMPGKGCIDAIFVARQLQERFIEKKKDLYFAFVDLEKAFDRVPREVVKWAMRKLGIEEWVVRIVMAMYEGSNSVIRINNTLGKKFGVKVGVHQGSVLSPLLFIMVLEAISRECREGLPWEMLYADDLVLIDETAEDLEERYKAWRSCIEGKGLRVNLGKTKVMISGTDKGPVFRSGKHPCGVCCKGVGNNSIYCDYCKHWVHKRCSGLQNLNNAVGFKCKSCANAQAASENIKKISLDGVEYDVVDQFCYLGDMLSAGGGAEACTIARIRSGWKKFRELLPLLTGRVFSHKVKGKLYRACVRSVMLYASETWPLKEEDIQRISRTDTHMVRWMCGASLKDRKSSEELRSRLGIPDIKTALRQNRLRWFGHVERMGDNNPVSGCRFMEVDGQRGKGRPRKTWSELIKHDLEDLQLQPGLAKNRDAWKIAIR